MDTFTSPDLYEGDGPPPTTDKLNSRQKEDLADDKALPSADELNPKETSGDDQGLFPHHCRTVSPEFEASIEVRKPAGDRSQVYQDVASPDVPVPDAVPVVPSHAVAFQRSERRSLSAARPHGLPDSTPSLHSVKVANLTLQSGYYGMQGRRPTMEDFHTQIQDPDLNNIAAMPNGPELTHRSFFAIFDGHGGPWCADYCSRTVHQNLVNHSAFRGTSSTPLVESIIMADAAFCNIVRSKGLNDSSGTTAIIAYIVDDHLMVANVGDSRAVLCRGGSCIALSSDHKPNRKDEKSRITSSGGFVGRSLQEAKSSSSRSIGGEMLSQAISTCCSSGGYGYPPYRVYPGGLAISRSIGDLEMKASRLVINTPEIVELKLRHTDEFIILGCDGVWDVMSNEEAIEHVRAFRKRVGEHPMEAAKYLANMSYAAGSTDNISVLVIFFKDSTK